MNLTYVTAHILGINCAYIDQHSLMVFWKRLYTKFDRFLKMFLSASTVSQYVSQLVGQLDKPIGEPARLGQVFLKPAV